MPANMAPCIGYSAPVRTVFTSRSQASSRMQRKWSSRSCRQPLHSLLPLVLLLVCLSGPSPARAGPLDAFNRYVALRETWVRWIAGNVTEMYRNSCSALKACDMSCSRLACSNYFPNLKAEGPGCSPTSAFASTFNESACGTACKGGSPLSFEQASVRLSPDSSYSDAAVQRDVCALNQAALGETFRQLFNSDPVKTQWLYVGTATGVFNIFPSKALYKSSKSNDTVSAINTCAAYDPRLRPWYVAGASGPKDVVILIDVSRSLLDDPYVQNTVVRRLDVLKVAMKNVLFTLSASDFVSVIAVNGGATTLLASGAGPPLLVKAIFDYPELLSQAVAGLNASQSFLNITSGLELAFRTFQNSAAASSGCTRLLAILSDGLDVVSNNSFITDYVEQQQRSLLQKDAAFSNSQGRVKILAYNLRTSTPSRKGADLLQALACENDGVYRDADTENLSEVLRDWYTYAAATNSPAWTQSYGSISGGNVTTCTLAVYDTDGSLIGVVGTDVDVSVLEGLLEDPRDLDSALGALYTKSSQNQCPIGSTSEVTKTLQCALERRRGTNCSAFAIAGPAPAPGPSNISTPAPPEQCPGIVPVQKCVAPSWTAEQLFCPVGPHVDFKKLVCCASCNSSAAPLRPYPSPDFYPYPYPDIGGQKGKNKAGVVAGAVVGSIFVVAVCLVVVCVCKQKKRSPKYLGDHVIATSDHPGLLS